MWLLFCSPRNFSQTLVYVKFYPISWKNKLNEATQVIGMTYIQVETYTILGAKNLQIIY